MKKNTRRKNEGITLIALVITIIVLLILAGVTIATLTGDNGILTKATEASKETEVGKEKEQISLAYTGAIAEKTENGIVTAGELQNQLEKIVGKDKTIVEENDDETLDVSFVDSKNNYNVDNEIITSTTPKIGNKKITVTNSNQEIIFHNTITQEKVDIITGKSDTEYSIIGISSDQETYGTTANGEAGTLEVYGDINDATFIYNMNNFMQGDETFFVKYTIDGVEQEPQKLSVIQGDIVTYEDDFEGITYSPQESWKEDINENYSEGTARKGENTTPPTNFQFTYYGEKFDIITRANENIGLVQLQLCRGKEYSKASMIFAHIFPDIYDYKESEYGISLFEIFRKRRF